MRRFVALLGTLVAISYGKVSLADPEPPFAFEEKPWVEGQTEIPAFPKPEGLIEFYVGPTERNRFYVDGSTISIGDDGIVRYVVVIKTAGGANNVNLEAMRCATREVKLFAVGHSDDTWSKVPAPRWQPIESKLMNQYRSILNRNFFCPAGHTPRDASEARAALRQGKHPDTV